MRALTLSLILSLTGCCGLSEHDRNVVEEAIAINDGAANDETMTQEYRDLGKRNAEAFRRLEALK